MSNNEVIENLVQAMKQFKADESEAHLETLGQAYVDGLEILREEGKARGEGDMPSGFEVQTSKGVWDSLVDDNEWENAFIVLNGLRLDEQQ